MQNVEPLILTLCEDIFFIPRLQDASTELGFRFRAISHESDLGIEGPPVQRQVQLTEPLEGPDASLIQILVNERPALLIIDTSLQSIAWRNWIHVIKTSAATRRIPIIAFGAHVNQVVLQEAKAAGADLTISRSRFQANLAYLITEWASIPDYEAIAAICEDKLSNAGRRGIELISQGRYFKAHDVLENAWLKSDGAQRYLLRSLIHVSVIYFQIERGNLRGARKMLLRITEWLKPLPPECQGVDVDSLRSNLSHLRTTLEEMDLVSSHENLLVYLKSIPLIEK